MSGDNLPKLSMSSSSFGGSSQSINNNSNSTHHYNNGLYTSSNYQNANLHHACNNKQPTNNAPSSSILTTTTTTTSITNNHRYVKLNVGGRLFSTSLDTLTKQDNMLRAMFSGRMDVITDLDGYILIDRSGKHFEFILNYLRDEDSQFVHMNLDDQKSELELYEILKEAKFYCIQPLITLIEQKILLNKSMCSPEPYYGSSIVSMITSKSDLVKILNSTDKPCIRLLINRHNNKYSYTNTSDDNLLKNIELFERMAIKFKNRIMFIKDTTSNEEICCWYFHGGGKKLAEVCCTSIVYTTEKKQTKVEFPDSKILEEIFVNAVLFESKENANNNTNGNLAGSMNTNSESNQNQANASLYNHQNSADLDDNYEDMPRINLNSTNHIQLQNSISNMLNLNSSNGSMMLNSNTNNSNNNIHSSNFNSNSFINNNTITNNSNNNQNLNNNNNLNNFNAAIIVNSAVNQQASLSNNNQNNINTSSTCTYNNNINSSSSSMLCNNNSNQTSSSNSSLNQTQSPTPTNTTNIISFANSITGNARRSISGVNKM